MRKILNQLAPFVILGITLVIFTFGIALIAYLFAIGAVVGFLLFVFTWLRDKFVKPKTPAKRKSGRVIDSDDWKIL